MRVLTTGKSGFQPTQLDEQYTRGKGGQYGFVELLASYSLATRVGRGRVRRSASLLRLPLSCLSCRSPTHLLQGDGERGKEVKVQGQLLYCSHLSTLKAD